MLMIRTKDHEFWDEDNEKFVTLHGRDLRFEHTLHSVSKWESFFEKPWFPKTEEDKMTPNELLKYIEFMCLDQDVDSLDFLYMSESTILTIYEYINSKQTATIIKKTNDKPSSEFTTSEVIYYLMDSYNINWEAQYWHLNRLLTLIGVHHVKSKPPKKMSQGEILAQNKAINAKRRAQLKQGGQ